jgi:hypothetical protein
MIPEKRWSLETEEEETNWFGCMLSSLGPMLPEGLHAL